MGCERRMMCGRGPDSLPRVMEVDANGYLLGVSELVQELITYAARSREKVYPWDADGIAVVAGANHTWGDPVVGIPIDDVTTNYGYAVMPVGDIVPYRITGIFIRSTASPNDACVWNIFRIIKGTDDTLDGDSGAGEPNPDRVHIPDTSGYLVHDLVWVADDNTVNGEMRRVEAITATYLDLDANLNNAYTVVQNARVYLVRRDGDSDHNINWGKQRASGVNATRRSSFYAPKYFAAGDGAILRARDVVGSMAPNQMSISLIFDSEYAD